MFLLVVFLLDCVSILYHFPGTQSNLEESCLWKSHNEKFAQFLIFWNYVYSMCILDIYFIWVLNSGYWHLFLNIRTLYMSFSFLLFKIDSVEKLVTSFVIVPLNVLCVLLFNSRILKSFSLSFIFFVCKGFEVCQASLSVDWFISNSFRKFGLKSPKSSPLFC